MDVLLNVLLNLVTQLIPVFGDKPEKPKELVLLLFRVTL